MSFTEDIKNELCKIPISSKCCASAEGLGMLLYGNRFAPDKIRLVSSVYSVRKRAQILIRALFGCELTEDGRDSALMINSVPVIKEVFEWYGFQYKSSALSLNRAFVEEDCCKAAFLRGCFLMGGYVTAGKKGYHLELVTPHFNVSKQVSTLLYELQMEPGAVTRRSNYVLYYKNSELIETFLSEIGATGGAMDIMLKKVEKALVNNVNRKVNCETANLDKVLDAAEKQLDAIRTIEIAGAFESLPSGLKETLMLRRDNPMASMSELAAMFDPPISKAGVNSRLKKLIKISEELKQ
ncbi:MAG: DNA-binding protein WhiA [Clostridiaceae bacterium]|nr:DNA-binding protein WhiA [Clostridiaceae bacterium]